MQNAIEIPKNSNTLVRLQDIWLDGTMPFDCNSLDPILNRWYFFTFDIFCFRIVFLLQLSWDNKWNCTHISIDAKFLFTETNNEGSLSHSLQVFCSHLTATEIESVYNDDFTKSLSTIWNISMINGIGFIKTSSWNNCRSIQFQLFLQTEHNQLVLAIPFIRRISQIS